MTSPHYATSRPGRFDQEIEIGIPIASDRVAILNVILANVPHSITAAEISKFALGAHGYVGADLAAVVKEAGLLTVKRLVLESLATKASLTTSIGRAAIDLKQVIAGV